MTKISVVMPVYNVEQFVALAIRSVLMQTYEDFELLIVNDCSPDNSLSICEGFNDGRIKIIQHESNRGLAGARNTGIRHSVGKYIAFIDSDDMWHEEKLEKHIVHLESDELVGVSFSRSAFIDQDGKPLNAYQMPALDHVSAGHYLCRNPIGNGSAPVIRRECLKDIAFTDNLHGKEEICYFDEKFRQSEDIECWIRIRANTQWRIVGLTEALTLYRLNSGGLSSDIPKQLASWEAMLEKTSQHSPELVQKYGKLARAFQLRYLARQAIRLRDGMLAAKLVNKAIICHPSILFKEPSRTIVTVAASYVLILIPKPLCKYFEPYAVNIVGYVQKCRIALTRKPVTEG